MGEHQKVWRDSFSSDLVLERLEERIVLDGTVDQTAAASYIDWYDSNFHYFYWDSNHLLAQQLSTGAWWYYDNINNMAWEYYGTWFWDSSWGALAYNEFDYSYYWWDANHYFCQDHNTYVLYYYDNISSMAWESFRDWFWDSASGAMVCNDYDFTLYSWDADHYFYQSHSTYTWYWYDNIDDYRYEPFGGWFYSDSESHWEYNGWDTHVYLNYYDYTYFADSFYLYDESGGSWLAHWEIYTGSDNV